MWSLCFILALAPSQTPADASPLQGAEPSSRPGAEPPLPDAPPLPPPPVPADAANTPSATEPPAAVAPPPPHPTWQGTNTPARRVDEDGTGPVRRRRVTREQTVEVCGFPITLQGTRAPLLLAGSALALLASVSTAAVGLVFLLDLAQAQRMVLAVDRAQVRGDTRPERCSGSWGACRDPYLRSFWGDVGGMVVAAVLTLLLATLAVGLFLAAALGRLVLP